MKPLVHIDRWGPGVLSIITLCAVIVLAWNYDRQLDAIKLSKDLEIASLKREIDQIRADNREREHRLRTEFQKELLVLRSDLDFESAKAQNLRERLMKEGRVN